MWQFDVILITRLNARKYDWRHCPLRALRRAIAAVKRVTATGLLAE